MTQPKPKPALPKSSNPVSVEELLQQTPAPTREQVKAVAGPAMVDELRKMTVTPDLHPGAEQVDQVDELDALTDERNELRKKVDELDALVTTLTGELTRSKSELTSMTINRDRHVEELRTLREELTKEKAENAHFRKAYQTALSNAETLGAELEKSQAKRKALRVALSEL